MKKQSNKLRDVELGSVSVPSVASGALAIGALAVDALAIGALAIGRLSVGPAEAQKLHLRQVEIDDLTVKRLHLTEGSLDKSDRN